MKKWIIGLLVILGLAIGSSYIFIPSTIVISNVRYVSTFRTAVAKFLTDTGKITDCFQKVAQKTGSGFQYRGFDYTISKIIYGANEISISSNDLQLKSNLIPAQLSRDSCTLNWFTEIQASNNPFKRIMQYYNARKLKAGMSDLMDQMKLFLDDPINMYGIKVTEIQLKDSILISIKTNSEKEPGNAEIYEKIKKLEDYALGQDAKPTNSPMLNVLKNDSGHFEFRVGLPISKTIAETNEIHIKKMPYNGNMLITEIKGGPYTIKKALQQLDIYKDDAGRTSPAIHYELLITNRVTEPDTSKWITRLYYPVM